MPEGPEVECVKRDLQQIIGKKVTRIELTPLSQKYPKYQDKQHEFRVFFNHYIEDIMRFGKFLVWRFSGIEKVILNHLGMSGRWSFYSEAPDTSLKHINIRILFEESPHVVFDDIRNFGQFRVFPAIEEVKKYPPIRTLGVDGLKDPFPLDKFLEILAKPNFQHKSIGEVIIDQRVVAGVGNIYKAESLFEAQIHPLREVQTLNLGEKEVLGNSISKILHKAVACGGSTFGTQRYSHPSGEEGEAQIWHGVYGRENKPCNRCDTPIERIVQKNRSTFFCPKCQS